jgi:predicted secreted hydrolase
MPCNDTASDLPLSRRALLRLTALACAVPNVCSASPPRAHIQFPADHGAHLQFRLEWWYITGYVLTFDTGPYLGFQVTFFRSRVPASQGMQSGLAARQLVFAHAAITDTQQGKLWHDQRIARYSGDAPGHNPADIASCSTSDLAVTLKDWSLVRRSDGIFAKVRSTSLSLDLQLAPTQEPLLQGDQGLSRKGPDAGQESHYYSLPQLQVRGELALQGRSYRASGSSAAWMDHEWSDQFLHPQAAGWDWIGINLQDGGALTAFQVRHKDGSALWHGGSIRRGVHLQTFAHESVSFRAERLWRSPLSGANYPVEWTVQTPAERYTVTAVVDNQELDSRLSTGMFYWEGLCEVRNSQRESVGRGYLEMTGYARPVVL